MEIGRRKLTTIETGADLGGPNGMALGSRLRMARAKANRTLEDVARDCGITPGHLSRLERGEKLPSIGALVKLARAFETTIVELLGSDPAEGELIIARAGARPRLGAGKTAGSFRYEMLLREAACAGQLVTAFIVHPEPEGGAVRDTSHQGLEFIFVLSGAIEIVFAERTVTLSAGDVLLFPGYLQHRLRRPSAGKASALVVMIGA